MMMPTAISITLPRIANALNSLSISFPLQSVDWDSIDPGLGMFQNAVGALSSDSPAGFWCTLLRGETARESAAAGAVRHQNQ
jgi:hypothetical protein